MAPNRRYWWFWKWVLAFEATYYVQLSSYMYENIYRTFLYGIMKSLLSILGFIFFANTQSVFAQSDYLSQIHKYQKELNIEFKDKEDSPLEKKDRRKFEALDFFDIDSNFRVKAKFMRTPNQVAFEMPTSTDRKPIYEKYGEAHFTIEADSFKT